MSIRWYRTFLAVAHYGSFAAAAQEIGLTQAAVSVHMRALEQQLRLSLFDRGARSAILNTAGRALVTRAQALVDLYDGMGGGLEDQPLGGLLALGAIPPTFSQLLPDALLVLRQSNPRIGVRVSNGVSSELYRRVETGELDAAIVSEAPFDFGRSIHW
jgi:DNA-binding transcriptional LysR family regulator